MCYPAIIAAVIALAGTAAQVHAQNQASDRAAKAIENQANVNRAALSDRSEEVTEDANLARFEKQKQNQREMATTRVAQSEGGVLYGNTALRTMASSLIQGNQDLALIDKQETRVQSQISREVDSVSAGAAVNMSGLKWTSPLMAGVQGAGAGLSTYNAMGGSSSKW